ncbi:manganese peroxidase 1 [Agrocybe pediades]|nr:manganese peroxidase 1 [Agrocybe pediades]
MALNRLSLFVAALAAASQWVSAATVPSSTSQTASVETAAAFSNKHKCPTGQTTSNPICCKLFPIVDQIQKDLFDGGECGEEAHSALRLTFHDAIGFSIHGSGGGADGSILAFNKTELAYHANGGIDEIVERQFPVFLETGLTAGDFVHLAGAIGTANCPGAPRLDYFFGRPAPKAPAPDLTVPEPTDSVTKILARMADAGFSAAELVALLSSHSIAAADVVDTSIPGTPFDSTVDTFDTQVFLEVLLKGTAFPGKGNVSHPGEVLSPIAGEMRLQSDAAIARDSRTACLWQDMIDNQQAMMSRFKAAMSKMQVLGQHGLTDCSDVIPTPKPFKGHITFPPTFSQKNVQVACKSSPFPKLKTVPGPAPTVAPV